MKDKMIASKLKPFGVSVFSEIGQLAARHSAINLAQGFPDFNGPDWMVKYAHEAMLSDQNQYSRSQGHPLLVGAISRAFEKLYGLSYNPMSEIGVFCGALEAVYSCLTGILNPGDEVILIEPFFDSYPVGVAQAGAVPRFHTLRAPHFELDLPRLATLFNEKTRVIVLNTPHNPTGKVFTKEELAGIARLCIDHDVIVISDEVYEHITFDGLKHVPIASLSGMWNRTLTIGSAGKTFSYTGWRVGWAVGPAELVTAAQASHQFTTFCAATPLQIAVAHAIDHVIHPVDRTLETLRICNSANKTFLSMVLTNVGFKVHPSYGSYFLLADFSSLTDLSDREYAKELIERVGVAAIPLSSFYSAEPEQGKTLLRFAFCKKVATLAQAERCLTTKLRR